VFRGKSRRPDNEKQPRRAIGNPEMRGNLERRNRLPLENYFVERAHLPVQTPVGFETDVTPVFT
jgi:hypothetical protein